MGLHHGGAGLRRAVEGHARVRRAHGAHHVQVDELLQLRPVHGGAEHQNLLLHKARPAQGGGLGGLADGEAADALLPQQPGQLHQPGPLAVAGEHRVDLSCLVFSIIYSQKVSVNEKGFPLVFRQEK